MGNTLADRSLRSRGQGNKRSERFAPAGGFQRFVWLALAIGLVFSCSSTQEEESVGQSSSAITTCSTVYVQGNGAGPLNFSSPTAVLIPAAVDGGFPAGSTVTVSLSSPAGNFSCLYTAVTSYVPPPSLTSCSNGALPGQQFFVTSISASASIGGAPWRVAFAISPDDGNPCTLDSCVGASPNHQNIPSGTQVSDGNICNGMETCNGTGGVVAGTPVNLNNVNSCVTDTCDPATGIHSADNGSCPQNPAVTTQPLPDPTLPTDFAAATAYLSSGHSIDFDARRRSARTCF